MTQTFAGGWLSRIGYSCQLKSSTSSCSIRACPKYLEDSGSLCSVWRFASCLVSSSWSSYHLHSNVADLRVVKGESSLARTLHGQVNMLVGRCLSRELMLVVQRQGRQQQRR